MKANERPSAQRAAVFALLTFCGLACAQPSDESSADLAKKLANPISSLISVPFKYDWDKGSGPAGEVRSSFTIQPVIPFKLDGGWTVVSRTILPVIRAESPVIGGDTNSGLGDITQSLFFSPSESTAGGWIWGAGPVFLLPTANNDRLGGGKLGLGPTAVLLKQSNGWTYGALVNHLSSVAGSNSRPAFSATYFQPFLSYTTKTYTTLGVNAESSYDWKRSQWTVPLNFSVSQLVKLSGQPVSFSLGLRSFAHKPEGGPHWGLRFTTTLLFPK